MDVRTNDRNVTPKGKRVNERGMNQAQLELQYRNASVLPFEVALERHAYCHDVSVLGSNHFACLPLRERGYLG
jgi:hypothetical protein